MYNMNNDMTVELNALILKIKKLEEIQKINSIICERISENEQVLYYLIGRLAKRDILSKEEIELISIIAHRNIQS